MHRIFSVTASEIAGKLNDSETDQTLRLTAAGMPVFLILSFIYGIFLSIDGSALSSPPEEMVTHSLRDEIYPVLIDQEAKAEEPPENEKRALSHVTSAGSGKISGEKGFHALTPYDQLRISPGGSSQDQSAASFQNSRLHQYSHTVFTASDLPYSEDLQTAFRRSEKKLSAENASVNPVNGDQSFSSPEADYRIPANYRFRSDFLLHYDDSQRIVIASEELQGFRYFQNMLRQIRSSFSPPGYNFAYRDYAGTVINQPIKPQTVQVLFSLDPDGRVRDVRVTASLGQTAVDQACINALAGQNFGPPPPEIFRHGNIFGINFVFPAVFNR